MEPDITNYRTEKHFVYWFGGEPEHGTVNRFRERNGIDSD